MLALLQKEIRQQLAEKAKSGDLKAVNGSAAAQAKRKRRWDQTAEANQTPTNTTPKKMSSWDQADSSAEVKHLNKSKQIKSTLFEPCRHKRCGFCFLLLFWT